MNKESKKKSFLSDVVLLMICVVRDIRVYVYLCVRVNIADFLCAVMSYLNGELTNEQ